MTRNGIRDFERLNLNIALSSWVGCTEVLHLCRQMSARLHGIEQTMLNSKHRAAPSERHVKSASELRSSDDPRLFCCQNEHYLSEDILWAQIVELALGFFLCRLTFVDQGHGSSCGRVFLCGWVGDPRWNQVYSRIVGVVSTAREAARVSLTLSTEVHYELDLRLRFSDVHINAFRVHFRMQKLPSENTIWATCIYFSIFGTIVYPEGLPFSVVNFGLQLHPPDCACVRQHTSWFQCCTQCFLCKSWLH